MCDPVTISAAALFALQAGSQVAGHIGTNQAYKANQQAANYSFARDTEAINRQDAQLQAENSERSFDTAIAIAKDQGAIAASAATQGLAAGSIASQLNAGMFGIGRQATAEDVNFRNQRQEVANSRTDAELRRQNQINSRPRSGALQLALGIGEAAASSYSSYQGAKRK